MSTLEKNNDEACQNMVSNLPLLFSGGYPTTLDKISESELENFIPFMVQCSLGGGCSQFEFMEPEWWPEDVPFKVPFTKPLHFKGDWLAKMKEIVAICYEFHKSIFLLRFCNELASYERECLRFINNLNSTTSLFERTSNRLLVTFRNENMLYDQQFQNNRPCLLPRTASSQSIDHVGLMVEPPLFDIYLCDNCDAELYSLQAYKEHEKSCQSDDDVIICEPDEPINVTSAETYKKMSFLSNMNLQSNQHHIPVSLKASPQKDPIPGSPDKYRHRSTRQRAVLALGRCPTVPFSSPLGQFLIQKSKFPSTTEDYVHERLERIERFCIAPSLSNYGRPRWLDKRVTSNPVVTFKRPHDHPRPSEYHYYNFPRRQFSTKSRDLEYEKLNSLLLKKCRPCSISLRKMTENDITLYKQKIKSKRLNRLSTTSSNINLSKPIKIVEYIDLCSSDDDDDVHIIDRRVITNPNNLNGNVMSISIDTKNPFIINNSSHVGSTNINNNNILLEKPFNQQHIKGLFTTKSSTATSAVTTTNLNNSSSNNNYFITNKLTNREHNIIKIATNQSTGRSIPQLVRIAAGSPSRSPQDQRRSLTAHL